MPEQMSRRDCIVLGAGAALALATGADAQRKGRRMEPTYAKLPRWRGFNLTEKFTLGNNKPYVEADFDMIAEWGFDFVRLPTDYRCWTDKPGVYKEAVLKEVDQAVAFGKARGIHVNLCLHRAPGYCVNPPKEPLDMWADGADGDEARKQFAAQWHMLAARYKGVSSSQLSFDLVNEPSDLKAEQYERAVKAAVEGIRSADPKRLIVADGLYWGNHPVPELAPLKIAQSTRGYSPMQISHFRASWIGGSDKWETPTWPLKINGQTQDKEWLRKTQIEPFQALQKLGVGVHVGEWGAFSQTPHDVVLAWMKDQLDLWKDAGWGWSMWEFRGSFGILNSGRADVQYEDYKGLKLDRKMLELIKQG